MSEKTVKKYTLLVWGLLECLLFSGVVYGWAWIAKVLTNDGYFVELCNTTDISNINLQIERKFSEIHATLNNNLSSLPLNDVKRGSSGLNSKSTDCNPCTLTGRSQIKHKGSNQAYTNSSLNLTDEQRNKSAKFKFKTLKPQRFVQEGLRPHLAPTLGNVTQCERQSDRFLLFISLAHLCKSCLIILVGILFDLYGTMRMRFVCVLFVIVGTLMMTFTTPGFPWLMIPAMCLMGLSGVIILLTNLQVANLFGRRRYTLVSIYVGAHDSGGIVAFLMTLSYRGGINMQTSFMFLTISIVPILVSTIALLPKIRIPWPLPANYGKRRGAQIDELSLKQEIAWKRERGENERQQDERSCMTIASQSLILCCVAWYAVHSSLAVFIANTIRDNIRTISGSLDLAKNYTTYNSVIQLGGVIVSPLVGILLDRRANTHYAANAAQMQNIAIAFSVTNIVSLLTAALSAVPVVPLQLCVLVMTVAVRVFSHTAVVAFLMHVNFPQEMFGRLYGFMMVVNSIVLATQYPFKLVLDSYLGSNPLIITLAHILLLVVIIAHPANIWRYCRHGMLKDRSGFEMERRRKSSFCDASLVQKHLIQRRPTECQSTLLEVENGVSGAISLSVSDLGALEGGGEATVVIVIPHVRRSSTRPIFENDTIV